MKNDIWKKIAWKIGLICIFNSVAVFGAQNIQQPSSQIAKAEKQGKDAVCDGAMEIIPSGQMSFVRKRYIPTRAKSKTSNAKVRTTPRR